MMSASSASSTYIEEQFDFSANSTHLRDQKHNQWQRKCYNCDGYNHFWQNCTVKMEDCFICKIKFDKF